MLSKLILAVLKPILSNKKTEGVLLLLNSFIKKGRKELEVKFYEHLRIVKIHRNSLQ